MDVPKGLVTFCIRKDLSGIHSGIENATVVYSGRASLLVDYDDITYAHCEVTHRCAKQYKGVAIGIIVAPSMDTFTPGERRNTGLKKKYAEIEAENIELKAENMKVKAVNAKLKQTLKEHEIRITNLEQIDKEKTVTNTSQSPGNDRVGAISKKLFRITPLPVEDLDDSDEIELTKNQNIDLSRDLQNCMLIASPDSIEISSKDISAFSLCGSYNSTLVMFGGDFDKHTRSVCDLKTERMFMFSGIIDILDTKT
ncbi:3762_t:CDS:2 [Scutellospora calospora]|uniref:3762_t:CDS:1 n=1 Tax=Scutellospora calospora TaxID=85575 RepID=A0ACA9JUA7_9GLOM|nr:3762_t:CDS:2 [Scutellospora calospora]